MVPDTMVWGKRVIRKISIVGSRASYGPYHGLELPNHGIATYILFPVRDFTQNIHQKIFFWKKVQTSKIYLIKVGTDDRM